LVAHFVLLKTDSWQPTLRLRCIHCLQCT
jgi:hypothetical protein